MTLMRWGQGGRDAVVTMLTLVLLLAWDATGLDLVAARLFGNAAGFASRDTWWASTLLHDGGRQAAWLLLAVLLVTSCLRPPAGTPSRGQRWRWLGVTLACVVLVPSIKRVSLSSCPYELAEFGGLAQYVSHWRWGVADGGPGHCFPSGHAVSSFAFIGLYFLWRHHAPRRARALLAAVVLMGLLFGTAQLVRGAHYPSHTLWTAWLCWALCVVAAHTVARPAPEPSLRSQAP
jgi:membrane-associated PAP2 superfamily phosphatase